MIASRIAALMRAFQDKRVAAKLGSALHSEGGESGRAPKIFYGVERVPGFGEKTHGGLVKAQSMQERFPNAFPDADILYLISSALPREVETLIRLAKERGLRVVLNQNGVAYPSWHGPGWEDTNTALGRVLHSADYVIYQSEFCKMAADQFLGTFTGEQLVLYNPVETDRYEPTASIGSLDPLRLLVSGSHGQAYRVEQALRTTAELIRRGRSVELMVAGRFSWASSQEDGEEQVRHWLRDLNLEHAVHLHGVYAQSEAAELFRSADMLLHTKYNDACPRLVVEALASGLPVVYSSSGGTPELVGDGAGVGVSAPLDWDAQHPPDPILLADGVETVLSDYESYRSNAVSRARERFGMEAWLDQHELIFQAVCK